MHFMFTNIHSEIPDQKLPTILVYVVEEINKRATLYKISLKDERGSDKCSGNNINNLKAHDCSGEYWFNIK